MLTGRFRCAILVAVLAGLAGCATDARMMLADLRQESSPVELVETPFHAQVTDQCGPSALATVLEASGVKVAPETLKSQVYIPGREGSLQIELLAASRGYKRVPYVIDRNTSALLGELRNGRAVLVLQNLGPKFAPAWHYAVVVGYLPDERRFVLRSGDRERHLVTASSFVRTWRKAGYWGIVALKPGEMPAVPNADAYVRAVAAIEAIGDYDTAITGYAAATEEWPGNSLAWLGLGNAYYAAGNPGSAESAYRNLLAIDPDYVVALNNLAQVQADRGCYAEASDTLDAALVAAAPNTTMHEIVLATRRDIESGSSSADCTRYP